MKKLTSYNRISFSQLRAPMYDEGNTPLVRRAAPRSVIRVAILLAAFLGGRPAPFVAARTAQSTQQAKSDSGSISDKTEKIKFKITRIGNGQSDEGTWWTKYYLETSEGHTLSSLCIPFSNVGRANKEFQVFLKYVTNVIQRDAEPHQKGETNEHRVLASITDQQGRPSYILFWTNKSLFCQITGEYSDDLLVLEKRLKEKSLLEIAKESEPTPSSN